MRAIRLEVYEYPVNCPYCRVGVIFRSLKPENPSGERTCPSCTRVFMLDNNGKAVRIKKASRSAHA